MQSLIQENVNPDIPGILIMSHGPLAVGIVESAKMLFAEAENIAAFTLEEGDDPDDFRKAFAETFDTFPDGSIVMVDIFGGSPCNQTLRYAQETNKDFELLTGVNLPMVLDAVTSRAGMSGKEFSENVVENSKSGIARVDIEAFLSPDDEEDDE